MYQIGKHEVKDFDLSTRISEDPGVSHLVTLTLETTIDEILGSLLITGHVIKVPEYDRVNFKKTNLYKKPPAKGPGIVPAARLAKSDPGKTLRDKILGWYKKRVTRKLPIKAIVVETNRYLSANFSIIEADLKEEIKDFDKGSTFLLLVNYANSKVNTEFSDFLSSNFQENVYSKFSEKFSTKSMGEGDCFYCAKKRTVNGFIAPYSFYTHDKVTYASNLIIEDAWKQFPVCNQCAVITEEGKKKVEQDFSHFFYGIRYLLFPKSANERNFSQLITRLEKLYTNDSSRKKGKANIVVGGIDLTSQEEIFIRKLKKYDNDVTFTFLFYYKENAAFVILTVINDVLPSRLSVLDREIENLNDSVFLRDWWDLYFKDTVKNAYIFKFGYLRALFPRYDEGEKTTKDIYRQQFLELTGTAFRGSQISSSALIQPAVKRLQHLFSNRNEEYNERNFFVLTLFSFALVDYFYKIGCITNFQEVNKTMTDDKFREDLGLSKSKQVKRLLKLFGNFEYFDGPEKKGIFILGVLTREVTQKQYKSLNSSPFYESLDGLRLTKRKVKQLFPKVIGKLLEYRDNINWIEVKALETLASHYFMQGDLNLTNEEICFSFALGLSYQPALWARSPDKGEQNE